MRKLVGPTKVDLVHQVAVVGKIVAGHDVNRLARA